MHKREDEIQTTNIVFMQGRKIHKITEGTYHKENGTIYLCLCFGSINTARLFRMLFFYFCVHFSNKERIVVNKYDSNNFCKNAPNYKAQAEEMKTKTKPISSPH